jgi:hypothetical protein
MKTSAALGRLQRASTLAVALSAAAFLVGCSNQDGSASNGGDSSTPTSEESALVTDVPVAMGSSIEVANLTATVEEVRRQKAVSAADDSGYVVAKVTVANESNAPRDYHRLQFRLRKPDGTSINRTPVAGVTQLGNGELQPGERVSGELIFLVEQAAGQFAVLFEPIQENEPEPKRGVWAFESQPGDAR